MILVVAIEPPHQRESEHYDPLDEVGYEEAADWSDNGDRDHSTVMVRQC